MAPESHSLVVGLNFKSADLQTREKLSFPEAEIASAFERLKTQGYTEIIILSTCNRVEIYTSSTDPHKSYLDLCHFLADYGKLVKDELQPHLYFKHCNDAVTHLFSVASGIDSMVVGEYQILHQIKRAYEIAQQKNMTGQNLNKLFQSAIQVGKLVQTNTAIGAGAVSIGSIAVDLVKEIFPQNSSFRLLLLGAGEVAELTASHLKGYGNADIRIASRTEENAMALIKKFGGSLVDFENRHQEAAHSDIVIVSTAAPHYILNKAELSACMHVRKGQVCFYIDLSVPRNIDPDVQQIDEVILYSIDDLQKVAELNRKKRSKAVDSAKMLIDESIGDFSMWYAKQKLMPTIQELRSHFKQVQDSVLRGFSKQMTHLSEADKSLIHKITDKLSQRITSEMLMNIEKSGRTDSVQQMNEAIRQLHLPVRPTEVESSELNPSL